MRASSVSSVMRPSSRATCVPRHACVPAPNERMRGGLRVTSNPSGLLNSRSSRFGGYAEELACYVKRAHIPPLDVIRWATLNGAELAGRVLGVPSRLRAIVRGGVFGKDELSP